MDLKQSTLINELKQGKQLANQLKNQLDKISPEKCEFLIGKLLSSYEKSLSMLNWSDLMGDQLHLNASFPGKTSSRSEKFGDKYQCRKDNFKTRKAKMSKQTRVSCVQEGDLEDGYSWRKYGQKEILGTNFPRAYYRCSHRHTQGCFARKQVQKSDEDPSMFEITYKSKHTCIQSSNLSSQENHSPKQQNHIHQQKKQIQQASPSNPSEHENSEYASFWFKDSPITSTPIWLKDSPIDNVDFETNFSFDIQEFFS